MASQVEEMYRLDNIVRGHPVYKKKWTPLGEILRTTMTGTLHVCVKKERNHRNLSLTVYDQSKFCNICCI